jgi:hypothetical protein
VLETLFLGTLGLAIIVSVLTAFDKEEIAWPILSFVTWIVLAVNVANIEIPTAHVLSTDTVLENISTHSGGAFMIMLFTGFAVVFMALTINRVMEMHKKTTAGPQQS